MSHTQKFARAETGTNAFTSILLGLAAAAAAGPTAAQSTSVTAMDHETTTLQEVVVTARKRDEKLLEVPAPVSAISAETLALTQAVRLEDYLKQIPGATFDNARAGQTKVIFRGINAGDNSATVVTYIDNVPLTPSGPAANSGYVTLNLDPSDLAQIEVDRGPQGTLYGANAIGGVLKYVTVKPDPNNFSGRIEASGEAVAHGGVGGTVRGAINVPLINDKLGLRVSAYNRNDPGYIDDPQLKLKEVNSDHVSGGRAALLWNASDSLTVNLSAMVQLMRAKGNDYVDYDPFTGKPLFGDLTHGRYLPNEWFTSRNAVYNADIQWDLKWAKLLSSTSYSTLQNGGNSDLTNAYGPLLSGALGRPNTGFDNPLIVHGSQITEELRLTSSGESKMEWQIGGYFTRDQTRYDQSANLVDIPTQTYVTDYGPIFQGYLNNQYIEHSGFGNIDYHFTPQFDVALGARYSVDDQKLRSFFQGLLFGDTINSLTADHERAVTWAVNPRYKINQDEMIYARVATGYRPGGGSLLVPAAIEAGLSPTFKPEHLISYETGWKASLFDRRVTVDVSVYYIRWTDVQEAITVGSFVYGGNGGAAHSQGVETSFTWLPVTGLNLSANLTYDTTRLDHDEAGNPDMSKAGLRLPGTPKFSGNFAADYNWPLTESTKAFVGGSVFFTTARPSALILGYNPNNPSGLGALNNFGSVPIYDPNTNTLLGYTSTKLPGYTTVDLRAGVDHGPWTVEAYVKNLTDVHAYSEIGGLNNANFANYSTQWTAVVLRPRTVGVSLARKF